MIGPSICLRKPVRALAGLALGALLSGCADMSDGLTSVFADPAKYNLYDCKQLETERKSLATRMAELRSSISYPARCRRAPRVVDKVSSMA